MTSRKLGTIDRPYDVAVVGGGINGGSAVYHIANNTDIGSFIQLEKEPDFGLQNSSIRKNSGTPHEGDIETNITHEKATWLKPATQKLIKKAYELDPTGSKGLQRRMGKLLLGIGEEEVAGVRQRAEEFKDLFPHNLILGPKELEAIEPFVMKGRQLRGENDIIAYYNPDSTALDFGGIGVELKNQASEIIQREISQGKDRVFESLLNTRVSDVRYLENKLVRIGIKNGDPIYVKSLLSCAAPLSVKVAKELGHLEYTAFMPMSGSFYPTYEAFLKNKNYTYQIPGAPNAAMHGDPLFNYDRYGPTASLSLTSEDYHNGSFGRYLVDLYDTIKIQGLDFNKYSSMLKSMTNGQLSDLIISNIGFQIPVYGRYAFVEACKKIGPSLTVDHFNFGDERKGVRMQAIDIRTNKFEYGEKKYIGSIDDPNIPIILNTAPSPGASTAMFNGETDAKNIIRLLNNGNRYFENGLYY